MTQQAIAGDFTGLAADYDRYRIGYSGELFDILETFGLRRGAAVLDVGCGTGLSAEPLAMRGLTVTGLDPAQDMLDRAQQRVPKATFVAGNAERLPFPDRSFDAAISAQAFHWFDAGTAFSELIRVVKPGGSVCVWWKLLGSDDPIRRLRKRAAATAGVEPAREPLQGGFSSFYNAAFAKRTLRVLPFVARFSVGDWLGYERSRAASRDSYGARLSAYLDALSAELVETYGSPSARLDARYTQFLYVGETAPQA